MVVASCSSYMSLTRSPAPTGHCTLTRLRSTLLLPIPTGTYVGVATVGAFCSWYMFDKFAGIDLSADGHSTVTFGQLRNWQECHSWEGFKANNYTAGGMSIEFDDPCEYFTVGVDSNRWRITVFVFEPRTLLGCVHVAV